MVVSLVVGRRGIVRRPMVRRRVCGGGIFRALLFSFRSCLRFDSMVFPAYGKRLCKTDIGNFHSISGEVSLKGQLTRVLFSADCCKSICRFTSNAVRANSERSCRGCFGKERQEAAPFLHYACPVVARRVRRFGS